MAPPISIGLPVYNGAEHLAEALTSLLAQEYGDFELIISDNASTDATEEICRAFAGRDRRIHYHRQATNGGAAANYNRVFELSLGRYFKWATHDDVCAPAYLRRCMETVRADPGRIVLCYGKTILIDGAGAVIRPYEDHLDIRDARPAARLRHLLRNLVLCNAIAGLIRADALRQTGLIGTYGGADVVLLAELVLQGEFWEIPEPLFYRRMARDAANAGHETPKHMHGKETSAQIAAWFDPRNRERLVLPGTRRLWEHLRAIKRAGLSWSDKLECTDVLLQERLLRQRQWRVLGGEVKQAVRRKLARTARRGATAPARPE
jgi:glycosyltransferase involved in cell wall biosynthesis